MTSEQARDRQVAVETVRPRHECPSCNPGGPGLVSPARYADHLAGDPAPPWRLSDADRVAWSRTIPGHLWDPVARLCECGVEVGVRCDAETVEQHLDAAAASARVDPLPQIPDAGTWPIPLDLLPPWECCGSRGLHAPTCPLFDTPEGD